MEIFLHPQQIFWSGGHFWENSWTLVTQYCFGDGHTFLKLRPKNSAWSCAIGVRQKTLSLHESELGRGIIIVLSSVINVIFTSLGAGRKHDEITKHPSQQSLFEHSHTSYGPSASAQPTEHCSGPAGLHGACDSSPTVFHPAAQLPWKWREKIERWLKKKKTATEKNDLFDSASGDLIILSVWVKLSMEPVQVHTWYNALKRKEERLLQVWMETVCEVELFHSEYCWAVIDIFNCNQFILKLYIYKQNIII